MLGVRGGRPGCIVEDMAVLPLDMCVSRLESVSCNDGAGVQGARPWGCPKACCSVCVCSGPAEALWRMQAGLLTQSVSAEPG